MHGSLADSARVLGVPAPEVNASFRGVSTDTRTLAQDNLFLALNGPNYTGADFVSAAREAGAAAAITDRQVDDVLPQLVVDDTRDAIGALARDWRRRFSPQVIGITGSNGKTTTRSLIAACCGPDTLATVGNLNNDIGVPLTLFRLDASHRRAVIEMGANHQGEIAALAAIAEPSIGIVTNAGPAHLEGFGGIDGVAQGKGELFKALDRGDVAVINADDVYAPLWRELAAPATVRTFGSTPDADVWFDDVRVREGGGLDFRLNVAGESADVSLALDGRHNAMNAAGAAAAALAAGVPLAQIVARLSTVMAEPGRQRVVAGREGAQLVDDSYNANPASMRAGAASLVAAGGRAWMVVGDMGELGDDTESLHAALGRDLAAAGVERLFALGPLSAATAQAFGELAEHFEDHDALAERVAQGLAPDVRVLVKGSRSMRMEHIVERLRAVEETA
ncbi:MAG: UDP-N-acetylmuramoyl-tripeptide--D-alanyl-D-alanine ligase [Pseudomonadota bacterium]